MLWDNSQISQELCARLNWQLLCNWSTSDYDSIDPNIWFLFVSLRINVVSSSYRWWFGLWCFRTAGWFENHPAAEPPKILGNLRIERIDTYEFRSFCHEIYIPTWFHKAWWIYLKKTKIWKQTLEDLRSTDTHNGYLHTHTFSMVRCFHSQMSSLRVGWSQVYHNPEGDFYREDDDVMRGITWGCTDWPKSRWDPCKLPSLRLTRIP